MLNKIQRYCRDNNYQLISLKEIFGEKGWVSISDSTEIQTEMDICVNIVYSIDKYKASTFAFYARNEYGQLCTVDFTLSEVMH